MLLAVFGHDAVMAANPHASAHAATTHEAPAGHAADAPCGPTQGVRSQADDDPLPDTYPLATLAILVTPSSTAPAMPPTWTEPDHPPDVRRALLQVFRN